MVAMHLPVGGTTFSPGLNDESCKVSRIFNKYVERNYDVLVRIKEENLCIHLTFPSWFERSR